MVELWLGWGFDNFNLDVLIDFVLIQRKCMRKAHGNRKRRKDKNGRNSGLLMSLPVNRQDTDQL